MRKTIKQLQGESDYWRVKFINEQQRAEVAEAECTRLNRESQNLSDQLGSCDRERRDLRAKLAELEKQEPVAWHVYQWRESPKGWDWYLTRAFASEPNNSDGWRSVALFTRPAPAVSLAELVPGDYPLIRLQKAKLWIDRVMMDKPGMKEAKTISAILRNIEEAK